ncbi:hypothetical protein BB559_003691 [Furculomyces boomerangus]|uniref:Ubiquitin thioesterase OTU n=1 Tax=Furculomyces boomerangus TaxID=61424 RepID=A0A2T9YJR0_9FUNG|nr:hypothetical protein BB559_003691 [Furculomyces boomerangus]
MRFRLRHSKGTSTLSNVDETKTFAQLLTLISETTGFQKDFISLKVGYPPQTISPENQNINLVQLPQIKDGETLTITYTGPEPQNVQSSTPIKSPKKQHSANKSTFSTIKSFGSSSKKEKYNFRCGEGYLLRREIPDDNSCLFRAVTVSNVIEQNPEEYPDVILGRNRQEYINWIMKPTSWGGAIEMKILAEMFGIEICAIDIKTLKMYQFGQGMYPTRIILLYSGIHYDAVTFNKSLLLSDYGNNDVTIFPSNDKLVVECAIELANLIKEDHGYTDTKSFNLVCSQCGEKLRGEKGAQEHAGKTGHVQFKENK